MEAGFVALIAIVAFIIGVAIGTFVGRSTMKTQGVLNVDYHPDFGTGMYLNATVPIEEIARKKRVTFKVHILG